jgi:hypothetical protein
MKYQVELTDLFCGEANYSWVRRDEITLSDSVSDLAIVRAAKLALGISGTRCKRETIGETIQLKPYGSLTVAFITPIYWG